MSDEISQDGDTRDSTLVRLDLVEATAWLEMHPEQEYVEFGFHGPPGIADLTAIQTAICAQPGWTPRFSRIFHIHPDTRLGELDPETMKRARDEILALHLRHYGERLVRAANLVGHDHNRPLARLWEAMNSDGPLLRVKLFSSHAAALDWVTEPGWRARP